MTNKYKLVVKQEQGRLDAFIAAQISELSRTRIKELIQEKLVLVNGRAAKAAYQIQTQDVIDVTVPALKPLILEAEAIALDIIYEDEDVIVVNKPQGMVVHPAAGHHDHTLVNALLYHTKELAASNEGFRPGIVHRIDKDTSGLLMVAKNSHSRQSLEKQLANKTNKRQYLAIVHGNFTEQTGLIDAPIGRNQFNRKKMAVVDQGKPARTHFTVLEQFTNYSLIACRLETGRTHQIRVHLAYIGHPVAGDPLYGPHHTLSGHGQFLHAQILGFNQPSSDKWLEFKADPPAIFKQRLTELRRIK